MIDTTYEITMLEPMIAPELEVVAVFAEEILGDTEFEIALTDSGRILLISGDITIEQIVEIMGDSQMADDVGLIRQITEYVPEREMILIDFQPE